MALLIANRQRDHKINARWLREIAATLLAEIAGPEAQLEINLVSPAQMAKVNESFLRHEGPTDVITFDYRETAGEAASSGGAPASSRLTTPLPPAPSAETRKPPKTPDAQSRSETGAPGKARADAPASAPLHGELFICPAVAVSQAREFGTDWRAELVRYIIHGLLHLQGYDDLEPAARRQMKRAEARLLKDIARRFALSKL